MITNWVTEGIKKNQDRMRAFFFVITALPLGIVALPLIYKLSIKQAPKSWGSAFEGKKVLILGTGPSSENFKNCVGQSPYDAVVYLNHAVDWSGGTSCEWFFSTDVRRVKEVFAKRGGIVNIPRSRRVLAPIAPFQIILYPIKISMLNLIFNSKFSVKMKPLSRHIFWKKIKISLPYFFLSPKVKSEDHIDQWLKERENILHLPLYSGTSALSAMMFAAFSRPALIHLMGCDFQDHDQRNRTGRDRFEKAPNQFARIQRILRTHGVDVRNLSGNTSIPQCGEGNAGKV